MPAEVKYLKIVKNPSAGDVVVWDVTNTNKYGHVAILLGFVGESLLVFEQDGFKQDGAKINLRNKKNILGFLRKK